MLAGHHKSSGLPPAADGTDAADALRGFLEEGEGLLEMIVQESGSRIGEDVGRTQAR